MPSRLPTDHFDDFFRPLDAEMGFSLNVNLGGFVDEVRRVSADFRVRTWPMGTAWGRGREPNLATQHGR
jgi:hypothetical protein